MIISLLAQNNYAIYNKNLAHKIGVENTILLATLCSLQTSFSDKEFYREENQLVNDTALSIYAIRKAKKELEKLGILQIIKKGMPAKHYFKINENEIINLLEKKGD